MSCVTQLFKNKDTQESRFTQKAPGTRCTSCPPNRIGFQVPADAELPESLQRAEPPPEPTAKAPKAKAPKTAPKAKAKGRGRGRGRGSEVGEMSIKSNESNAV